MLQNNPLLAQLKQQLHKSTPRIEGVIRTHEKGYGFLEADNKKSYFIPNNLMKKVLHGDKVSGIISQHNGKDFFEPETLIKSTLDSFLGQIVIDNKTLSIQPEFCPEYLLIRCKVIANVQTRLKTGDWVKAKLVNHPLQSGQAYFLAEVTDFIVENDKNIKPWLITLARFDLENSAPPDQQYALLENEATKRQDLTHIDFFTIDNSETHDMDDALSIRLDDEGNFVLSIAIADPTAYIAADSELEKQARQRHFSTYLPHFNVPMLTTSLTNNLCSLRANEKRPAMVCKVTIDTLGNIMTPSEFSLAWVISKAKLSYQDVSDYLTAQMPLPTDLACLPNQVDLLAKFTEVRLNWRKQHALLFKEQIDYRFVLDNDRKPIDIEQEARLFSHKIIEEAMVVANLAVTTKLQQEIGLGLFNCHGGFDVKYIDNILKILHDNGITDFDKERVLSFEGYGNLRRLITDNRYLEQRLLRYQLPADFAFTPKAHFGLGFSAYATWTSPMRKYGDMLNHRILKNFLADRANSAPDNELLPAMNERRKKLRLAEKELTDKLYAQYLSDKIGTTYTAELLDINRGGARVKLLEIGAMAFMPLSLIRNNSNEVSILPDEGKITINSDKHYQVTDQVMVEISQVKLGSPAIIVKLY